jgi:hypothetical protein
MDLNRVTEPWKDGAVTGQSCEQFKITRSSLDGEIGTPVVIAEFHRFGGGEIRQPDFEVVMRWRDIEQAIEKFCIIGNPEAVAVREAIRLATAAKDLGWRSPEPT